MPQRLVLHALKARKCLSLLLHNQTCTTKTEKHSFLPTHLQHTPGLTYAPLCSSVPWKGVARGKPGLRNSDGFPLASSHITALAPQMPKKHAFLQVSLTTPSQSDVSPLFSKRARWEECRGGRRARDSEPPSFAKGFPALSQSPDS